MTSQNTSSQLLAVNTPMSSAIGWKIARASLTDNHTLLFKAVTKVATYNVEDRAVCCAGMKSIHDAPASGCGCGFNAWDDVNVAYEYYHNHSNQPQEHVLRQSRENWWLGGFVMLRVSLFGDVIEGTLPIKGMAADYWGYKAERQRVTDLFVEKRCYFCESRNVALHYYDRGVIHEYLVRAHALMAICPKHVHEAHVPTDPALIAERNGIGVHWGRATSE